MGPGPLLPPSGRFGVSVVQAFLVVMMAPSLLFGLFRSFSKEGSFILYVGVYVCMSRQSTNSAHSYRNPIVPFRAFLHLLRVSILTNKFTKIVDRCPNQRRLSGVRLVSQSPL